MSPDSQTLRFIRHRIPAFECEPGCHDCCGQASPQGKRPATMIAPHIEQQIYRYFEVTRHVLL